MCRQYQIHYQQSLACPLTLTPFTQSVIGDHFITSSLAGVLKANQKIHSFTISHRHFSFSALLFHSKWSTVFICNCLYSTVFSLLGEENCNLYIYNLHTPHSQEQIIHRHILTTPRYGSSFSNRVLRILFFQPSNKFVSVPAFRWSFFHMANEASYTAQATVLLDVALVWLAPTAPNSPCSLYLFYDKF